MHFSFYENNKMIDDILYRDLNKNVLNSIKT